MPPPAPQELLDEIERLKNAVANALSKANAKYADAAKQLEAALMLPIGQAVQRFKEIIDSLFEVRGRRGPACSASGLLLLSAARGREVSHQSLLATLVCTVAEARCPSALPPVRAVRSSAASRLRSTRGRRWSRPSSKWRYVWAPKCALG